MAVTANQLISRADGTKKGYPVAASTHIYQGALSFVNASGYLDDDTASGVNAFAGVNVEEKDNSAGLDAALSTDVWRCGEFLLTGSGFSQASVGVKAYATDNYTVTTTASTSGAVYIGKVVEYVSSTAVWVAIDTEADEGIVGDSVTTKVIEFNGATGVNEIHIPTNLADALSIEVSGVGDLVAVDTSTGAIVFTFGAAVRVNVAGDFQGGSATTDLVAFHGATPTDQCAAYTQTYSTADRTHANVTTEALVLTNMEDGSANNTLEAITDTSMSDQSGAIERNFDKVGDEVNALQVDLLDLKQLVNAIIDDMQEKGLVG